MFLTSLFHKANENIRYAVLRNYKRLPNSTGGSDLDILIHHEDLHLFIKLLNRLVMAYKAQVVSVIKHPLCPRYCVLGMDWGIQIDLHIGCIFHKNVVLYDWDFLCDYIKTYNNIRVLDDDIANIISFLKEVLNNKTCKANYLANAHTALEHFTEIEHDKVFGIFDVRTKNKLISILKNNSFDSNDIRNLGKKMSSNIVPFHKNMQYKLLQVFKLKRIFKKTGYAIVFMGTDGSGKSTIIQKITPILNEAFHNSIYYEHLRPNYIPSLAVVLGKKKKDDVAVVNNNPHGNQPSGFLGSLFRLNYYLFDYTIGYMVKIFLKKSVKSCVWIFDRYYYDYYIDPKRNCISLPPWIVKFYGYIVPSPDLIICLGTDANVIRNRKPELPLSEIKRQVSALKVFAQKEKKAIWIDSGCSEDETVCMTMDAICKMMEKRGFRL